MLLETARRYNHETECITFLKDFTYSKDDFHRAGTAEWAGRGWGWCPCWATTGRRPQATSFLSEPPFLCFQSRVSQPHVEIRVSVLSAVSPQWDAVQDEAEGFLLTQDILIRIKRRHSFLPKPGVTTGRLDLSPL